MSLIVVEDDSSDEPATLSDDEQSKDVHENGKKRKRNGQEALTMDERSYDAAESVSTADNCNDDEDKPLLELMKHLINYNGKQNTKLTNSQLIGILKKEFGLDNTNLHFISVDIYMNVLKKFLKDWPQWDEFDQVMHETRCMDDHEEIEKMLNIEYTSLKEYLATILKATEPFAKEAALKLKRSEEIPESSRSLPGDVVLEINCTRDQLNRLFFRKPHPKYKSTIFNIDNSLPSKISINQQTLQSMLNSYVNIHINTVCFKYKREMLPNFKHTLINKKLRQLKRDLPLNKHLQSWKNVKTQSEIDINNLKLVIEKIQRSNRYGIEQQYDVDTIFKTISEDFKVFTSFKSGRIELPCTFRFYMSKYPYVRRLFENVENDSEKYDLQLEEKTSPMLWFNITRLSLGPVNTDSNWLRLECSICQTKYHGVQGIEAMKVHFREAHQNEPDWYCTNCDRKFAASQLAAARWQHVCDNERTHILFES